MNSSSGAEVRQHILNVAKPIMLHKGFSAVGLNEILAAAGIPKGSFYHYFGSKEAFGEALLESYFEGYAEHIDHVLFRQPGTGAERLMGYWSSWLHAQCTDDPQGKCLAVKLGAEVSDLSEAMRAVLKRGTSQIIERLAHGVRIGLEDGSLTGIDDPYRTAAALYELWLGATLLEKVHRDRKSLEIAMAQTLLMLNLPASFRESA